MLYRLLHLPIWIWMRCFHRLTVRGLPHVPATGGALLAANHANYFDPVYVGSAVAHRQVTFMSVLRIARFPPVRVLLGWVNTMTILHVGGFNRGAMREFAQAVADGRMLLVFPEGHRTPDGELHEAARGVGSLAITTGAPVVPVLILGAYRIWPRWRAYPIPWGRLEVRFGPPLTATDVVGHERENESPDATLARLVMERIAALRDREEPPLGFWAGLRLIARGG